MELVCRIEEPVCRMELECRIELGYRLELVYNFLLYIHLRRNNNILSKVSKEH
jgi:hypothetical protein